MMQDRKGAARRRLPGVEAVLLLVAAAVFGEVCTLPVALAGRLGVAAAPPGWMLALDDAYIFVRYAQQAARGRPWQWNAGELSTGASSTLWTLLLVPPHWISGELAVWSLWSRWMGVASLWALGLAAARALRVARLPTPWPLVGGLCLVWSGPVGFGAVAGMESAANAALLMLAAALWMESLWGPGSAPAWRAARVWTLVATALLPLARPENGALTLLAALAMLVWGGAGRRSGGNEGNGARSAARLPWPRWCGVAVLVPGIALASCDWLATGSFAPTGALAKSWLYLPFQPLGERLARYLAGLAHVLAPTYLGIRGPMLWPPVGVLAVGTVAAALWAAAASRSARGAAAVPRALAPFTVLAPLAVIWLGLAALAPLSGLLWWEQMRHHHSGLAAAWVLAVAGTGLACEALAARRRERRERGERGEGVERGAPAATLCPVVVEGNRQTTGEPRRGSRPGWGPLALPLLLMAVFPHWSRVTWEATVSLYRGHARAAAWLAEHAHGKMVLLSDAGLLALVHDGPAIDALGLGSPDLTAAFAHGSGALLESLARRRPLPEFAVVDPKFDLPVLVERQLPPGPRPVGEYTVVARVSRELLAGAARHGPGLDFAYLPDEQRHRLRWHPPPPSEGASIALLLPGPDRAAAGAAGGEASERPWNVSRDLALHPVGAAGGDSSESTGGTAGVGLVLHGCRPLLGSLDLTLPPGIAEVRLRASVLSPAAAGEVVVQGGGAEGPAGQPVGRVMLAADHLSEVAMALPARFPSRLWLTRRGPGVPCLVSLRYSGRTAARP
jgi:hypothetical protein